MSAAGAAAEAVAAVEAPAAPVEGTPAPEGQSAETPAAAAPAKPVVSEVVRLAREKQRLERRVAELEKRGAPEPVKQHAEVSRDSVVAELKKQYEADPEAFLESVAGEDFYKLAQRVRTKHEAPEDKIAALQKEIEALKAGHEGIAKERQTEAQKAADKLTQDHIAAVSKEIDATDADGNPKYPTLSTLDTEALDETPALTAYNAVAYVWQKECTKVDEKTGQRVPFKKWTEAEAEARFHAAFAALETHYAKLRTPRSRTPESQSTQSPDLSPTISDSTSSGHSERPAKPATGTMSWQQAMRQALKEHGHS